MSDVTIKVDFGDNVSSDVFFVIELDDTLNLDGDGNVKTQFNPGDSVYFILHYDSSKVTVSAIAASAGDVVSEGSVTRTVTDRLSFTNIDDAVDLSHIPNTTLSADWFGNEPGITRDGISVTADTAPAIGDIKYNYVADGYRFDPPDMDLGDDDDFPVLIVVAIEAVST